MIRTILLALSFLVFSYGCATTSMSSTRVATSTKSPKAYSKILFYIPGLTQEISIRTTKIIKKKVAAVSSTQVLPYYALFSSDKKYSKNSYLKILKANQIDAVLIASHKGSGSTSQTMYLPTYDTERTSSYGYVGNTPIYVSTQTTVTGSQPVDYSVYHTRYDLNLYDIKRRELIWQGGLTTTGYDNNSMIYSAISKIVSGLKKDRILMPK